MKHYLSLSILIFTGLSLTRCAIVIPPTGGAKDEKAPVFQKAIPAIGNTNFKGGIVLIEFDEEIEVDPNINNIIVSPMMKEDIQVREKKKKYLELTIPSNLEENTTYSISLNNTVKDITEANILKNVIYAFSTGPLLDSLTLTGKTVDIESKQPLKDILVGLYETSDTLNINKQKPLYLTYSDQQGIFKLNYLKKGNYFVIALEDKNKNLLFDNQEKSDFIEQISLSTELRKPLTLELSISDTTGNKLLSKKTTGFKQEVSFRNGLKHYRSQTLDPSDNLYTFQDKQNAKNLTVFAQNFQRDSLVYFLFTTDSLGNELTDTIKLDRAKKESYKETALLTNTNKEILPDTKTLIFTSNKPIISFLKDSIFIHQTVLTNLPSISKNGDSLYVPLSSTELKEDTLKVNFKKGSLIFYDQDSLKQNSFSFLKADPANYSMLEMKIQTKEPHYIIQLLTEDYRILEEYKNITILKYNYINPGSYRIRVIVDKNGNGHWDRANPALKQKAEPIYYYNNDKLSLKPNWELRDLMFIF